MPSFHSESTKRLFQAIALLETEEECAAFFEDICTITEIQDMAQRLDAAILLSQGANYQNISKTAGVSTATISRVSRCVSYGSGGYKLVIDRLNNREETK